METERPLLARRLGMTVNVSPLRFQLRGLMDRYPTGAPTLEDWLADVANSRRALVVSRAEPVTAPTPTLDELSDEELVTALCLPSSVDHLQYIRLAAQLISRGRINLDSLIRWTRRERTSKVLGALAEEALKVDPDHVLWQALRQHFPESLASGPLLHWSRLAFPVPDERGVASGRWRLVA